MEIKKSAIKGEDSAHRRGLVLGLTMAEIMVLILFALLLALTGVLAGHDRLIQNKDKRINELIAREEGFEKFFHDNAAGVTVTEIVERIQRQQNQITELQREINRLRQFETDSVRIEDIIHKIQREMGENPTPEEVVEKLRERDQLAKEIQTLRTDSTRIEDIIHKIQRGVGGNLTPEELIERLKEHDRLAKEVQTLQDEVTRLKSGDSNHEVENLKGQIAQLSKEIKAQGRGNEFPSCWATQEGKVESIFELVITANGIEVHKRNLAHRAKEMEQLPVGGVQFGKELSVANFRVQSRPLYEWSVAQQCRFYVIIFANVQNARIDLINAINGVFYPDSSIRYRPGKL